MSATFDKWDVPVMNILHCENLSPTDCAEHLLNTTENFYHSLVRFTVSPYCPDDSVDGVALHRLGWQPGSFAEPNAS